MGYHIDTGLIKEKFKVDCECPLCEIKRVTEENFLHEFLNDAVMEENTRLKVNKMGFCSEHFDKLFNRSNKLSLALQIYTRMETLQKYFDVIKNVKSAKKVAHELNKESQSCIICSLTEQSMVAYYKTIAEMFNREKDFYKTLINSKGFCMNHYAKLLEYSNYAGSSAKLYVEILSGTQKRNIERMQKDLKWFCDKHDYRNASMPMGNAETALPRMRTKLYGKKEN